MKGRGGGGGDGRAGAARVGAGPAKGEPGGPLRGAAVAGTLGSGWVEEVARTVSRLARVVVVDARDDVPAALEREGLRLLAAENGTVVAARD